MSAAIAADDVRAPVWQIGLWPPDRNLLERTNPRVRRSIVFRVLGAQEISPVVVEPAVGPANDAVFTDGVFACTWPGCSRGKAQPFPSARQLANHRFAAHGIRSTNEESMARQARRDKKRALVAQAKPPEYIDEAKIREQVELRFPINLPPDVRRGALDPGDREHIRRRLCFMISSTLTKELKREPALICVAIAEIAAAGLAPVGLNARKIDPANMPFAHAPDIRSKTGRRTKR